MSKERLTQKDIDRMVRARNLRPDSPLARFMRHLADVSQVRILEFKEASQNIKGIVNKYTVTALVTGVEMFFRDYFTRILTLCKPDLYLCHLTKWHGKRYSVEEMLWLAEHNITPIDLVIDDLNFQNFEVIANTFKDLIGKPFWKEVLADPIAHRMGDVDLDESTLLNLQKLIESRHNLIHHPDDTVLDIHGEDEDVYIDCVILTFATSMYLDKFIAENRKPEPPSILDELTDASTPTGDENNGQQRQRSGN